MNRISPFVKFPLALALLPLGLLAQNTSLGLGGVNSSYGLGNSTFNSVQYAITISIQYNSGLSAASYISPSQLTTDFQGFLNSYPNPGDPPEAILLFAAQGLAQQYSQFNLVTLDAAAGADTGVQAEIEASAGNIQVGALDRSSKAHKAAKPPR